MKYTPTYSNIQMKRGTSERWSVKNPVLLAGEIGYDTTVQKIKIGDGATSWNSLPYFAPQAEVMPVGSIIQTGRNTAPSGWLLCDGGSKATAEYPDLFAAIGYTYGGSGASFMVPNITSANTKYIIKI